MPTNARGWNHPHPQVDPSVGVMQPCPWYLRGPCPCMHEGCILRGRDSSWTPSENIAETIVRGLQDGPPSFSSWDRFPALDTSSLQLLLDETSAITFLGHCLEDSDPRGLRVRHLSDPMLSFSLQETLPSPCNSGSLAIHIATCDGLVTKTAEWMQRSPTGMLCRQAICAGSLSVVRRRMAPEPCRLLHDYAMCRPVLSPLYSEVDQEHRTRMRILPARGERSRAVGSPHNYRAPPFRPVFPCLGS